MDGCRFNPHFLNAFFRVKPGPGFEDAAYYVAAAVNLYFQPCSSLIMLRQCRIFTDSKAVPPPDNCVIKKRDKPDNTHNDVIQW